MTRNEAEAHVTRTYGAAPEYLWERYPTYAVFRHRENRKWFAVFMTIPKSRLGIREDGLIDVVNVKCAEELTEALWQEKGILPAYHMNKRKWLSVILDGSVPTDTVTWLLAISHRLTAPKAT